MAASRRLDSGEPVEELLVSTVGPKARGSGAAAVRRAGEGKSSELLEARKGRPRVSGKGGRNPSESEASTS